MRNADGELLVPVADAMPQGYTLRLISERDARDNERENLMGKYQRWEIRKGGDPGSVFRGFNHDGVIISAFRCAWESALGYKPQCLDALSFATDAGAWFVKECVVVLLREQEPYPR